MRITVQIYTYVEGHSTEDKPVASDLEIDWQGREIFSAILDCGRTYASVERGLVWHLLGGEAAGRALLEKLADEEREAS